MNVHIADSDIHLIDLRTRMPFKYGIATSLSTQACAGFSGLGFLTPAAASALPTGSKKVLP